MSLSLRIKRVPTVVSNYQKEEIEEGARRVAGCGRNCFNKCCLSGNSSLYLLTPAFVPLCSSPSFKRLPDRFQRNFHRFSIVCNMISQQGCILRQRLQIWLDSTISQMVWDKLRRTWGVLTIDLRVGAMGTTPSKGQTRNQIRRETWAETQTASAIGQQQIPCL